MRHSARMQSANDQSRPRRTCASASLRLSGALLRIVAAIVPAHGASAPPDDASASIKPDRQLTFDKVTNVHFSGTRHTEDQPSHLIVHDATVCATRCREEYGNPCIRFCPANVYEMVTNADGTKRLQINASNCVHCKTCDIMDPYQIIDWVPPEGGEGPQYEGM